MPNFDYINARLRGMRGRLIDDEQRTALRQQPDVNAFLNALAETDYAEAVGQARLEAEDLDAAMLAIRDHFAYRVEKVRRLFGDHSPVDELLRRYDVHNVRAILDGFAGHASKAKIRNALLPTGLVASEVYTHTIEQAEEWQEARDLLVSLSEAPWRSALRQSDLESIIRALQAWYYSQQPDHDLVIETLHRQADQHNIMLALRGRTHFVPTGHLSESELMKAAQAESITDAVNLLAASVTYRAALRAGLERYQNTNRLSDIEQTLADHRLTWRQKHVYRDPLGVGVVVGYLGSLYDEVRTLRLLAQKKGHHV